MPITSQHLAAGRAAPDTCQGLVLFKAQRHRLSSLGDTDGELTYAENGCQPDRAEARPQNRISGEIIKGRRAFRAEARKAPLGGATKFFETDCSRFSDPECAWGRPACPSSARHLPPAACRAHRRREGLRA